MKLFLAILVMLAVPLYIPVLPVPALPGLLAGLLGGYLAGTAGRAALAALLPSLVIAALITLVGYGVGLPWIGSAIAAIALIWLLIENVALLLGAVIGGMLSTWHEDRALKEQRALRAPRISVEHPAEPAVVTSMPAVRTGQPIARSESR